MCDGEISCALSHVALWNLVLENNLDYINIFEDDIYLGENAKDLLVVDYIPEDTDVLKLEAHGKIVYNKSQTIKYGREISRLTFKHTGAAGYSVTVKGARFLLNYIKNKQLDIAIDTLIFDQLLANKNYKVMQLSPAICIQDFIVRGESSFESSLDKGRNLVHENQKKATVLEKMLNEFQRIKRRMLGKKVPFK